MSGRTTAEIVADLQPGGVITRHLIREIAGRLAELDTQVAAVKAAYNQYDADLQAHRHGGVSAMACLSLVAKATTP